MLIERLRRAAVFVVLALAACATPPPEKAQEYSCPTGDIACIKQAQAKCADPVVNVFTPTPADLIDVSVFDPGAEISEATIMKRPTLITCRTPTQ